jgi:hypothetical protein
MNDTKINDIRKINQYSGITFSNFKKSEVKKALITSINNNRVEEANNWTAELVCAGHFSELWDIILLVISKYIHLANPKLPIYIDMRFSEFKQILITTYLNNELDMRNDDKIRYIFTELITLLSLSNKKPSFEKIKIKKDEFDLINLRERLKADSMDYGKRVLRENDPKEIIIAINEFYFNIKKKNIQLCYYWIEWIVEFDSICRKNKRKINLEIRAFPTVDTKYKYDVIWIIWEIILIESEKNDILKKIINSLLSLFSLKYTNSIPRKRIYILYFCLELILECYNFNIQVINNKDILRTVLKKKDIIYKNIKKNEESPKTDYLFRNLNEKSNIEKTNMKLEIINSIKF